MDNVKFDQTAEVEKSSTFNLEAEQALLGLLLVNKQRKVHNKSVFLLVQHLQKERERIEEERRKRR